jgi:hypothetical protein
LNDPQNADKISICRQNNNWKRSQTGSVHWASHSLI